MTEELSPERSSNLYKDTQTLGTGAGRDPSVRRCQDLSWNEDSILQNCGASQTFLEVSKPYVRDSNNPPRPYRD